VVVDAVASLGGISVETDEWGVDVVYAAGQKCLGAAPGLSPITFGPRALERLRGRKEPCRSWFLDALSNLAYWDEPHGYHHTGPTHLAYALHEALLVLHEEGLRRRFVRTEQVARALWSGLEAMGLELLVPATHRLPTLTSVLVPAGVDETRVRARLLRGHGIEIAGGLGELRGRIWRIGLMGHSCSGRNVLLLLAALEHALQEQGVAPPVGRAVAAAAAALPQEETA
jgi:alanine-glyoxylate transaminase/serine-glyoxylate transaminase/serine-pyruvate transaminase